MHRRIKRQLQRQGACRPGVLQSHGTSCARNETASLTGLLCNARSCCPSILTRTTQTLPNLRKILRKAHKTHAKWQSNVQEAKYSVSSLVSAKRFIRNHTDHVSMNNLPGTIYMTTQKCQS